jgi:NAD(P)-dependent dehydrogenase (short-subunit alcohol dehydrogenase family)
MASMRPTFHVNLVPPAARTKVVLPGLRAQPGARIVYTASRAAFRGDTPEYLAYAASKGGMVALAKSVARAWGKDRIASFVVAPGFVRTDMAQDFIDAYGEGIAVDDLALPDLTEPSDLAPLVVLLVSGLADHATGTTIDVNAGSYVH